MKTGGLKRVAMTAILCSDRRGAVPLNCSARLSILYEDHFI